MYVIFIWTYQYSNINISQSANLVDSHLGSDTHSCLCESTIGSNCKKSTQRRSKWCSQTKYGLNRNEGNFNKTASEHRKRRNTKTKNYEVVAHSYNTNTGKLLSRAFINASKHCIKLYIPTHTQYSTEDGMDNEYN